MSGKSSAVFHDAVMDEIHDLKAEFAKRVILIAKQVQLRILGRFEFMRLRLASPSPLATS